MLQRQHSAYKILNYKEYTAIENYSLQENAFAHASAFLFITLGIKSQINKKISTHTHI